MIEGSSPAVMGVKENEARRMGVVESWALF